MKDSMGADKLTAADPKLLSRDQVKEKATEGTRECSTVASEAQHLACGWVFMPRGHWVGVSEQVRLWGPWPCLGQSWYSCRGVNRGLSRTFSNVPNSVVWNITEDGNCTKCILLRVFAGGWYRSSSKTLKTEVSQRKHTWVDMATRLCTMLLPRHRFTWSGKITFVFIKGQTLLWATWIKSKISGSSCQHSPTLPAVILSLPTPRILHSPWDPQVPGLLVSILLSWLNCYPGEICSPSLLLATEQMVIVEINLAPRLKQCLTTARLSSQSTHCPHQDRCSFHTFLTSH